MKNILITGVNGVIGQILTHGLSSQYEIFGLDSRDPFSDRVLSADIGDYSSLQAISYKLKAFDTFDALIHLAAASDHLAPWEIVLKNNLVGTKNIYELGRTLGVKKIIFASSTHAFGKLPGYPKLDFKKIPIDTPFAPDSFYGVSKTFGENLAKYYSQEYAINFSIIRIGSVTADDTVTAGKETIHLSHPDLINIIENCLVSSNTFKVCWGVSDPDH